MQILYFGWVRSHIGHSREELELPEHIDTVSSLITWLSSRGNGYARALENSEAIRVAVNQEIADLDTIIADGDEIALFPPMTGG